MKKAIILHGTEGSADGNWFPWLRDELKKKGVKVWLPELPNPNQPSLKEWTDFVLNKCPFEIDQDTILIGHSSGAIAVLLVAQSLNNAVGRVISVGVFKDNNLGWNANNRLFDVEFDFEKMRKNCINYLFIHSDTDPYCPVEHAEYFAKKTDGKLKIIPGQGHFNLEQGPKYKRFPELLKIVLE